jgi:MprA protease rhombosortase-interaction domain-containing protein
MFGRYGAGESTIVTLSGKVQGGPWKQTVDMTLPQDDEGNSEIERMWAQKRVARLLSGERAGKGSNRDEIVGLCEGYSIVSPYASMLVLENDAEYKRWKIEQRNAIRVQRDRKSREVVQQKLADLRRRSGEGFEMNREQKLVSTPNRTKATPAAPTQIQSNSPASQPTAQRSRPNRGIDLDVSFPGGGGGGAIDPVTVVLTLSTAGAAAMAQRRRRRGEG